MSAELRLKQLANTEGVLDGSIQWGEEEGLAPFLVHGITVSLTPLRLGERSYDDTPNLHLNSIRFAVRSWKELEGRTFSFPNVVRTIDADGESHPVYDIYGSLQLGDEYHQVVMTQISFGQYEGHRIVVSLRGSIRSVAHPPAFTPTDFSCEASLTLGSVSVRGDLRTRSVPNLTETEWLVQLLLHIEDYEPPQRQEGRALFSLACRGSGQGIPKEE